MTGAEWGLGPPPDAETCYPVGASISTDDLEKDPYPIYRALQEREPVTWVAELGMWWVVRHQDAHEILSDDQTFTTASADSLIFDTFGRQMLSVEGDEHTRYKRAPRAAFQPRFLRERLERDIAGYADELIDGFEPAETDLRADFAAQLPIKTMLGLFGLPQSAAPELRRWYNVFEKALANFARDEAVRRDAAACVAELHALMQDGIAQERRAPTDGLLGSLVHQEKGERLSDEEICRNASIIMFGGISTVEALILNTVWALARHPAVEAAVRRDHGVFPKVIEEVLRWQSPVQSATRHVTRDVEFRGHSFREGDTVNCMIGAANRDPSFVPDPDRFDIGRDPPPRHLAFATGRHFCLGLHLARLEGRIAMERLYERLPGSRVEASEDHAPRGYEFRQPPRLPVVWNADVRAQA